MQNNLNLSQEAQDVIENFESQFCGSKDILYTYIYVQRLLLVSLYALQPYAREDVLSLLENYRTNLSELLSKEEISVLLREYKDLIKYNSPNWRHWIGTPKRLDDFMIPGLVLELCSKIASPSSGSKILIPYSCPEIFAYIGNDCDCDGYVTSLEFHEEWALSQMMSDIFNIETKIKDCRFNEDHDNAQKQYDYIFAFTSKLFGPFLMSEDLISLAEDFLKENGEMFCFVPYSFTCEAKWENIRNMSIDSDFEIEVIKLPNKFYFVQRESCVLHLKKTHTRKITLVNFTNYEFDINSSESEAESLIKELREDKGEFVWHGEVKDIKDYDLRPAIYLMKLPIPQEGEKLMALGDLVEVIENDDISFSDEEYPIIKMTNLSTDYLKCDDIEFGTLENSSKGNVYSLCGNILLFSKSGDMRVSRLSVDNKKVRLGMGIIPMKLKFENVITEDFLLRALTLEETSKQVKSYLKGIFISHSSLSTKDFLKLQILVPSLERQREICLQDSRARLSETDRKLLEEQKAFREDIHMKMHTIGQTIFNIDNLVDALQTMRQWGKGVVSDSDIYGKKNPKSVANIYEDLNKTLERLKNQVASFDRGYNKEPKSIALTDFIEDYIKHNQYTNFIYEYEYEKHHYSFSLKANNGELYYDDNGKELEIKFRKGSSFIESIISMPNATILPEEFLIDDIKPLYDTTCEGAYLFKKGEPIEWVKFPPEALTIIFDNIINNANTHGFSGRETNDNKVKIELNRHGGNYVITIANNGNPLHSQLVEKDVFTYGITSQTGSNHSGIGAHEVSKLMQEFGGMAEFISTPDKEYTITYQLTFKKCHEFNN